MLILNFDHISYIERDVTIYRLYNTTAGCVTTGYGLIPVDLERLGSAKWPSIANESSLVDTLPKTRKGKYTAVTEAH